MTTRKNASNREVDFKLAIRRIETGKSKSGVAKLSIVGVAQEAGVSSALIHNHYPAIAELIRTKQGATSRQQRNNKESLLAMERKKNIELRLELKECKNQINKLATINEMLLCEYKELIARKDDSNIIELRQST
jgi:hypothetical protein